MRCQTGIAQSATQAHIILPGLDEGAFLFGEKDPETVAKRFYEHGASTVVLKLGEDGAYCLSDQDSGVIPGFDVKNVVDPVGAGDGFAAGFLSGLLSGLAFKEAVERANAVGALVTMVRGDVEGLPERDRVTSFISGSAANDVNR